MAETTTKTEKNEKEYIIPLRRKWAKVPRYQRANKAIKAIKEFLARHMKVRDRDLNKIKLDKYLNEFIWTRGIRKPPIKVKVKAVREGDMIRAELSEMSEKMKFKKARLDKREKEAVEIIKKKKKEAKPEEEQPEEKKEEEKEKKAAVVEAGKELAKKAARTTKHQTKISKQPKRQIRQALAK